MFITKKNATYQKLEVLKTNRAKRTAYGEFITEGVRNINEAVKNGWTIASWIYQIDGNLSDWAKNYTRNIRTDDNYVLSAELMKEISGKTDTSELMAVVKMRGDSLDGFKVGADSIAVLFDRPSNHGNLGTVIRTCDAFGIDGLIINGHGADIYDAATVTASMGSLFSVKTYRPESNDRLRDFIKASALQVVATTAHKKKPISEIDFTRPTLIIIGNEADGVSDYLYGIADETATIPMAESSGATSLNAACAASVILYEAVSQRRGMNSRRNLSQ
jgi:TrmH family RNA methyltransferase